MSLIISFFLHTGLLRDLNENDTRIQEEREQTITSNYARWKELKEYTATSERR